MQGERLTSNKLENEEDHYNVTYIATSIIDAFESKNENKLTDKGTENKKEELNNNDKNISNDNMRNNDKESSTSKIQKEAQTSGEFKRTNTTSTTCNNAVCNKNDGVAKTSNATLDCQKQKEQLPSKSELKVKPKVIFNIIKMKIFIFLIKLNLNCFIFQITDDRLYNPKCLKGDCKKEIEKLKDTFTELKKKYNKCIDEKIEIKRKYNELQAEMEKLKTEKIELEKKKKEYEELNIILQKKNFQKTNEEEGKYLFIYSIFILN